MELFLGTFSRQAQSIKNSQLTRSVTTIWLGILTLFPSTTAFALALGANNSARINLAQKPWFSANSFSLLLSLLMSAFALLIPPGSHGYPFTGLQNVPLPLIKFENFINPQISHMILAPLHLRRRNSIRPVSCYAIFKGWLLLSQPPAVKEFPHPFTLIIIWDLIWWSGLFPLDHGP